MSELKKYLDTEREISYFRVEHLKKMLTKNDPSTKRLMEIEQEFLSIPFENIVNTLPELLSAIKIFRTSRLAFFKSYPELIKAEENVDDNDIADGILNSIRKEIHALSVRDDQLRIKEFREKGRTILTLLCLYSYIERTIKEINDRDIRITEREILNEIYHKYNEDIFYFYNLLLKNPNFSFINTFSKNAIMATKPLENICIESDSPFFEIREEIVKGKKIIGFFLPIPHIGREIMQPYHLHLFDEDGFNVSKVFDMHAKSVVLRERDKYYKFVQIIDLDKIKDNLLLLEKYHLLMQKIKDKGSANLKIDCNSSSIMCPCSRTEDEGLRDSFASASAIFANILKKTSN